MAGEGAGAGAGTVEAAAPAPLGWARLGPPTRTALAVVALFVLALVLVRHYAAPLADFVSAHAAWGVAVFFATSVFAVLMPAASNLPLVPLAVAAWGPLPTALLLWLGWIAGSALAFWLGRHARDAVRVRFPSVQRHADIDVLIDERRRLLSLVLLRMTFPVDVLSYALGLFSRATTLAQTTLSTALGAAPFALLFAWVPALAGPWQGLLLAASTLAFVIYMVLRSRTRTPSRTVAGG